MEFTPFPKVPRLFREMVITEKLDGTNASIWIYDEFEMAEKAIPYDSAVAQAVDDDYPLYLFAGSRKRFIAPGKDTDNYGFAAWVRNNAEELVKLGPGVHYGEWWGKGIQRGYGLGEKRFSLFNVGRWRPNWLTDDIVNSDEPTERAPSCCHVVPVLYRGPFDAVDYKGETGVAEALNTLTKLGSLAAPGFMNPEGIMIYHTAARQYFKKTFEGDKKRS